MELSDYRDIINERVIELCNSSGQPAEKAFFQCASDLMVEYGAFDSLCNLKIYDDIKVGSKMARVDGYAFDETDHSLNLFICEYDEDNCPARLTKTMLDKLYWRLFYFLEASCSDNAARYFDRGNDAYKTSRYIVERMNRALSDPERVLKIHLVIVTNRELDTKIISDSESIPSKKGKASKSRKKIKVNEFWERPVDIDLWPIDRFFEMETADQNEQIDIDFYDEFGSEGIPCLKGNIGSDPEYDAYIGIIPGKLLADIYIEYGSRVLEGNVRAFLGTKSAKGVNNGIKKTINNEPQNFFTYNNGIAVTASAIRTDCRDGQLLITGVTDLQIINGGQTTATLAEAVLKKTNPYLEGIYVSMKLTVISDREKENEEGILVYDQMVHDIARFANSQNKVTAADLFSNDPFHIWMEKASKRYLAPPVKYLIPTGWYYERARKKYEQEQMKLTGDELRRFQAKYPKKQIITKEQLAMYLTAIAEKPHLCSKGKNWVMKEYGAEIGEIFKKDKAIFNEYYFKKCICAAIIYNTVDYYLESNKRNPDFWYSAGGYKGNIVPYTVSKIMASIPIHSTLNWQTIWDNQAVSSAFMNEIAKVTFMANDYFCSCVGVLVSEHCKNETTWTGFRDNVLYTPDDAFINELIPRSMERSQSNAAIRDQRDTNELLVIIEVIKKGEAYWQKLLDTAIEGNLLSGTDLNSLINIIPFVRAGRLPSSYSGKIPAKTMSLVNAALAAESKMQDEGVTTYFDADDDLYELTLTDYKMH